MWWLAIPLVFIACTSEKSQKKTEESPALVQEEVQNVYPLLASRQVCAWDPNLHYSVYYPAGFDSLTQLPVLLLFDPHADAEWPLRKYSALADRYQMILLASADSKNGNGPEQTAAILQAMIYQSRVITKADTNRLFTAGFSGGARVAAMAALSPSGIRGLIVCGVGIPAGSWTGVPPHAVIALGGDRDMNLSEVRDFRTSNQGLMSRYQLIRYQGLHEWPPVNRFEQALLALLCVAQRDGLSKKDPAFLQQARETLVRSSSEMTNVLDKAEALKNILKCLQGMSDVDDIETEIRHLSASAPYRQAYTKEQLLIREENQKREYYIKALGTQDTTWWNREMKSWRDTLRFQNEPDRLAMIARVCGAVSLSTYMSLGRAVSALHTEQGDYFSAIYRLVDPANTEAWYLSAVVAAQEGRMGASLSYLDEAIRLGFRDGERCRREAAFASFRQDNKFQNLINKIP